MRWCSALIAAAYLVAACGSHRAASHDAAAAAGARSGCGASPLRHTALPTWTAPAFSASSGYQGLWAFSARRNAVAVLFAFPLRAGHPTDPINKVLWIMRLPRRGTDLSIRARPLHAAAPVIEASWPANASPGEIYPSEVEVPAAGCWHLELSWAGHRDAIDLRFAGA